METKVSLFFTLSTIFEYLVGLSMFILMLVIDWLNPNRQLKTVNYYIQEFIYTTIAIILGIAGCMILTSNEGALILSSILFGIIGSTIVRKISANRDKIADKFIDTVEDKIEDKIKNQ